VQEISTSFSYKHSILAHILSSSFVIFFFVNSFNSDKQILTLLTDWPLFFDRPGKGLLECTATTALVKFCGNKLFLKKKLGTKF